jgi:hypothetical protein
VELSASTSGQMSDVQVIFVFGELLSFGQYAAAAYCSSKFKVASRSALIAVRTH